MKKRFGEAIGTFVQRTSGPTFLEGTSPSLLT
jgi:hypothetical protein